MLFDILLTFSDVVETQPINEHHGYWTNSIFAIIDSSHLSTFIIALLLIIYGSFRALEQDKSKDLISSYKLLSDSSINEQASHSHVIETIHAIALPLGASLSLIIMFFFFDSLQTVFIICTAILSTMGFAYLLTPCCQMILRPCSNNTKISFGIFGRYTSSEIVAFVLSIALVLIWIITGHWLFMDVIATGLCISFIALVRLPNLKVSALLLLGLVIYDVFWVYFSHYIFTTNVMVRVATREAENPLTAIAKRLNFNQYHAPKLSLPGKIVFPSMQQQGRFSLLGLGDIIMPGLVLCFVLRFESRKRSNNLYNNDPLLFINRLTYFQCSLLGYCAGLITATISSEIFKCAQPALLFLVPFTLIPLLLIAYLKGDLNSMWSDPFTENIEISSTSCKLLNV
jgi:signal peptide peptidase-like protein 3